MTTEFENINVIDNKLDDLNASGYVVEVDPDEAELMGAFVEDALTVDDAFDSTFDGGE